MEQFRLLAIRPLNQNSYQVSRFIYHLIGRFSGSLENPEFRPSWIIAVFCRHSYTILNFNSNICVVGNFLRTPHLSILCGLRNSYKSRLRIILPKLTQAGCINPKCIYRITVSLLFFQKSDALFCQTLSLYISLALSQSRPT